MDGFGGFGLIGSSKTVRKKRSNPFRRPLDESDSLPDYRDSPSLSSTPPSVSGSKASSDDNAALGSTYGRKEHTLNQQSSRASFSNLADAETAAELGDNYMNGNGESLDMGPDFKKSSEDNLLEDNWKSISGRSRIVSDGPGNESKLRKVKLKVGGITHTIHAKTTSDGSSVAGSSSSKSSHSSYAPHAGHKLIVQGKSDDDHSRYMDKQSGLRGVPWKDFSKTGFGVGKFDSSRPKMTRERVSLKQSENYEAACKSKRVQKRRLLSETQDDKEDVDDEIRYLEKLKSSKSVAKHGTLYEDEDEVGSRKQRPISRVLNRNVDRYDVDLRDYNSSISGKEKLLRSERASEDTDYVEEEDSVSDTDPEPKKKQRKEFTDASRDSPQEMAVTTRRRALLAGRGTTSGSAGSLIEFPNGLPPAPPKKQKEQLSEVEQQLKRAEALQRRRMQVEKANRESEAEAIRKILGQDSSRKRREEKVKKRQEVLVQERSATSLTLASNAVRWVMGPSGTVVTFPDEMGLPCIFEQKSCSYPPPREKCAGPSCMNAYKYRDSKSKLPLCSLQCYKAIHEKMPTLTAS